MTLAHHLASTATAVGLLVGPVVVADASAAAEATEACDGVEVVVDAGQLGAVTSRCVPGDPVSGLAALEGAGHTYAFVPRVPGMICTIDGAPDPCNGAPADAYWSYWTADAGGAWAYSSRGAGERDPAPGDVDGWAFGEGEPPGITPPSNSAEADETADQHDGPPRDGADESDDGDTDADGSPPRDTGGTAAADAGDPGGAPAADAGDTDETGDGGSSPASEAATDRSDTDGAATGAGSAGTGTDAGTEADAGSEADAGTEADPAPDTDGSNDQGRASDRERRGPPRGTSSVDDPDQADSADSGDDAAELPAASGDTGVEAQAAASTGATGTWGPILLVGAIAVAISATAAIRAARRNGG